ncbi:MULTISPECIES: YihY family inner membrane protein [unclassified Paludibacterium]|uniref:YihY family inner membrane protein n=1 Tax=unclassified Paludibacterium TaxID=2618429 RepID=UPI00207B1C75|nr:YihY family inner membrane protein [Paludibacterium sp. B53371]BEV73145.1 YihY family inner membrane protein [Paludibacterium sp. THUN1379]
MKMNSLARTHWASFGRFLLRRMGDNRLMQVAGSLTFTTMLALVPLLTIALIVISALPMFADYSTRFKVMLLTTLMPEFAGKILTVYMRQFADNAEKLTAVGILMLAVTSLMLMATIERTFNAIWGVVRSRHWLQQTVVYWGMLTLGPVVLGGGLLLWHNLLRASHLKHSAPLLADLIQSVGAIGLTTMALSLLYRVVPNRHVPANHAYGGALLTALLLEVAKLCFGFYIDSIASYKLVYGAFASIPIVLLWVYCMWLVVLIGAVFTCALSYWQGAAWRRRLNPRRRLLDALQLLLVLQRAHEQGLALSPADLRREVPVGYDELGWILDQLALRGWVQQGSDRRWVLMRALATITMADLVQVFVYPGGHRRREDVLERSFDGLMDPLLHRLDGVSVAQFAESLPQVQIGQGG